MPVPGTLQFGSASAAVSEDIGHVTISVTRSGGSDGAVGVQYATADGSAQAPGDYSAARGELNWAAGAAGTTTHRVPILHNAPVEGDHHFTQAMRHIGDRPSRTPTH